MAIQTRIVNNIFTEIYVGGGNSNGLRSSNGRNIRRRSGETGNNSFNITTVWKRFTNTV